ncbi:MAG: hypothetical protein EBT00_14175 [Proteobacteria bacterium]|jgi:hypothetical protein|nr:hypothetical protein [Pseudomonadota bacterium]NBT19894.1 hypothetical protein [Pseudomonadota bacterium]
MTRTTDAILAEIEELKDRIEALEDEIQDAKDRPKLFDVTLRVATRPSTWGEDHVDKFELHDHFFNYMKDLQLAIHLDDEGDEIKVLSVKEVTNDNAKLDA